MNRIIFGASFVNVRIKPQMGNEYIIVALPQDHQVVELSTIRSWSEIETTYNNQSIHGFIASRFLKDPSQEDLLEDVHDFSKLEIHRRENDPNSTLFTKDYIAYPLGDPNRPKRLKAPSQARVNSILQIIDYLDVENVERYRPGRYTYCNIYAHDYAYLCNTYLPRIWWTEPALLDLSAGNEVVPQYGLTYREMNANSIYDWFEAWGQNFGWERHFDIREVQAQADMGRVCICSARHRNSNSSGHIACIVPSNGHHLAVVDGDEFSPLMSQAGRNNQKFFNSRWWISSNFSQFGFWVHK